MSVQDTQSADSASFEAIRAYEWADDQAFQAGLQSILSSATSLDQAALTLRAKCFFYSKKSGIRIDYDAFKAWLAQQEPIPSNPKSAWPELVPTPAVVAHSHQRKQSASILGYQSVDTTTPVVSSEDFPGSAPPPAPPQVEADSAPLTPTPEKVEASYPTSFARIVELITTGQPIPGIREIPNSLNTAPPSEATRPKRRKPWEAAAESFGGNTVEQGGAGGIRKLSSQQFGI